MKNVRDLLRLQLIGGHRNKSLINEHNKKDETTTKVQDGHFDLDSYLSINKYTVFRFKQAIGKLSNIYQNTSHFFDISAFNGVYILTISYKNI